ncbi:MAG: polysaccharide biosynthesis tyrosine autokinase [Bacteroidetes bacterium]|nr:polysaccharide biosynthesis tyrosine autokinase [Bacteroidota bacterium]
MDQNQINNNLQQQTEHEDKVDIMLILFKVLSNWHYFAISIVLTLLLAFVFNKYSIPVYEVKSTVLIKDDKKGGGGNDLMKGLMLFGSQKNVQNEIGVLQSYTLTNKAVKQLNFHVSYFEEASFKTVEIYKENPFEVIIDTAYNQLVGVQMSLKILSNEKFEIEIPEQNDATLFNFREEKALEEKVNIRKVKKTLYFGETYKDDYLNFKVLLTPKYKGNVNNGKNYMFSINDINQLTAQFLDLKIEPINKEATVLAISFKNRNKQKAIDFINALTTAYINSDLEEKNQTASNTIGFIDMQLSGITDSLHVVENQLQDFRTTNKIMNITDESKIILDKLSLLDNQKAMQSLKAKYYQSLMDYINSNSVTVAPSTMGIDDPLLGKLVEELIKTTAEKEKTNLSSYPTNKDMVALDIKINNLKKSLAENIKNIVNMSNISIREIDKRTDLVNTELNKLPATERRMINIQRKFKVNDEIYTYLLQKRAESAISKASNIPDNKIIDKARNAEKVYPKTSFNYVIAFILGILIPLIYLFVKDFLNNTIIEKSDIEKITSFPIIGHTLHNDKDSTTVVLDSPKSSIAESFRAVRTNLQFIAKGAEKQTIMITSTMVSEGKTFVAINLASIFALYGKRVLLMGFDLRKPKIYQDFSLTNTEGISSYLIGKSTLENIIQKSYVPNLDIIMAGPIPPNPTELIASEKNDELFAKLKEMYDYIIIDTPPVGLITDAYLLMKYSDANVFVTRQNFTNKKVFASIINDIQKRNVGKFNILVNDIRMDLSSTSYGYGSGYGYGYGYGSGYGYGYGYGYYSDDNKKVQKKSLLKRLKKF